MDFWRNIKIKTFKGEEKFLANFTQEELIYEKVKCATDSIYVIETYFYIFDQTKNNNKGEIVPFKLFPFQADLVKSYEDNRFNITNKYRQAGISTVTCAWLATYIAFNANRSVAIVANKLETARDELMKDVTSFIDMLPPFLHPKILDKNTATHKMYSNGSQVKAFATNSLRGYTPTFLFWDEAAWCENGESFWTGTLPTLSTGGNAALVSCVTKDTMVWSNKGLVEISEIIENKIKGSYAVDKYEVLGRYKKRESNIIKNNGVGKTKKITTDHLFIESTLLHKFWAYNNKTGNIGYTRTENIKKDDYVGIQYGLNIYGDVDTVKYLTTDNAYQYYNYKITEKFSDILALFYHKGKLDIKYSNGRHRCILYFNNLINSDYNIINNFFNEYKNTYPELYNEDKIKFNENEVICSLSQISDIFYYLDLNFDVKYDVITNRTISKFIRKFKGVYLKRFVKTFINLIPDKILHDNSFEVKINSILMGRQIQQILINSSVICSYDPTIDFKKRDKPVDRFLKVNLNYEYYINNDEYNPLLFDQLIPIGISHNIKITLEKYDILLPFAFYNRFKLIDIINKVSDIVTPEDFNILKGYVSEDIYWSKITNVEKNKNYTYDFSLPNDKNDFWAHSVIYNGIIGHQTPNGLDPVFYKTYNNAKNGMSEFVANELYWYYDPRYSRDLVWKKKNPDGIEIIIKEENKENYRNLLTDGWKPSSPWYESMASKFNNDKKKIAQELECVVGDSIITVRNENTKEITNIKIEDLPSNDTLYTVLNHRGDFVNYFGVVKHSVNNTLKFITNTNKKIEVTLNHILISENGEVLSNTLKIGDKILTKDGFEKIVTIEEINENKPVYDLVDVGIDSLYLTNEIVSHNCSFLGSGNNFIDEEHIRRIEETQMIDPIRMEYEDFFWIWEDPIKDASYIMVIDVSTGAGDDYSSIIILKQLESHLEQVAEFKHKVSPDTLGVIANDYGIRYNNAFAIVDITGGIGAMTVRVMLDLGYNSMHYSVSRHEPTKEKLNDYIKEDENGKSLVPGFVISTSNRGMLLTEMKRAVEANEIEIKSYRLVSEFKTFISTTNNRVADHRRSFNDDLVIALAMGIYVFSFDIRSVGMSVEKTKRMLSAITSTISDHKNESVITNSDNIFNPNNPYVTNNWLFKGLK